MTARQLSTGILVPLVFALSTGCGGNSSTQTVTGGGSGKTHDVSERDSGGTVHARVGDDVAVTLHSTYWQLSPAAGAVLVAAGPMAVATGGPSCTTVVAGSGCGTVRVDYRVASAGTARIQARRQSCGEAMRCTGSQGRWSVTVVATG